MGREVRRVPVDWQHPEENGRPIPLYGRRFSEAWREWAEDEELFKRGLQRTWEKEIIPIPDKYKDKTSEQWHGSAPVAKDYMPEWPEEIKTHFQMYEDTSEGTPISPVMETLEQLARWLADNNASALGNQTATYEQWLATCKVGWAVSAIYTPQTGLVSGVEYEEKHKS